MPYPDSFRPFAVACQVLRFNALNPADTRRVLGRLGFPEAEHEMLLALAQGCPGTALNWQDAKILEVREALFQFFLRHLVQNESPETRTMEALSMGKGLAGHKGDKYIYP